MAWGARTMERGPRRNAAIKSAEWLVNSLRESEDYGEWDRKPHNPTHGARRHNARHGPGHRGNAAGAAEGGGAQMRMRPRPEAGRRW
jgi:hypothetical protein